MPSLTPAANEALTPVASQTRVSLARPRLALVSCLGVGLPGDAGGPAWCQPLGTARPC